MTRVAIIPTLTDGKAGLWSTARSEGRIPLNWGALLGANGYDVTVISQGGDFDGCKIPGVKFAGPDEAPEVDLVLFGSTSRASSNWFGRSTLRAKGAVRLQWPTGGSIDHSGDVVAVASAHLADQVATECGVAREQIHALPSPVLPLAWWDAACGRTTAPMPERKLILWGARDAFAGSAQPAGEACLSALEQSHLLRLSLLLLSTEQYAPHLIDRFKALGGTCFTSGLHLGKVLLMMRLSVLCVTGPAFMGPTLTEAIFEDCAPLVWAAYRPLFPKLCEAASKHGVLVEHDGQVRAIMERIVVDWKMRAEYVDSCKFAFADHSPAKCLEAWRAMEARCGL